MVILTSLTESTTEQGSGNYYPTMDIKNRTNMIYAVFTTPMYVIFIICLIIYKVTNCDLKKQKRKGDKKERKTRTERLLLDFIDY